jgi:hypothetical protein
MAHNRLTGHCRKYTSSQLLLLHIHSSHPAAESVFLSHDSTKQQQATTQTPLPSADGRMLLPVLRQCKIHKRMSRRSPPPTSALNAPLLLLLPSTFHAQAPKRQPQHSIASQECHMFSHIISPTINIQHTPSTTHSAEQAADSTCQPDACLTTDAQSAACVPSHSISKACMQRAAQLLCTVRLAFSVQPTTTTTIHTQLDNQHCTP